MIETIEYRGYPNCLKISNGDAEIIVSTDFGPRVLHYGLDDGENIFGWHPEAAVNTDLGTWKPYGGHRLWLAPENMPLSYAPDNDPVEHIIDGDLAVRLIAQIDAKAHIQKEIVVSLAGSATAATIDHKITNRGGAQIELSAWGLTIMRPGGEAIVPNEPFAPYGPESLLPVRSMALWSYTDFTDPRWSFEKDLIRLRVDENSPSAQKIGVLNRRGWAGYKWQDLLFVKRFDLVDSAVYPDMNSNVEIYTAGSFVEVETLSPLRKLKPGESVEHRERWELFKNVEVDLILT
jgi:hypothetical protein